jgi:hypothetical protein
MVVNSLFGMIDLLVLVTAIQKTRVLQAALKAGNHIILPSTQ